MQALGLRLPEITPPRAKFLPYVRSGSMLYLSGMVNATADFTQHAEVIDGASELWIEVLGERGHHARSAIGVGSLPRGFAVEIEAIIELA